MTWRHDKTRQQRGYGREHEKMREHLRGTVIVCEECRRNGRTVIGEIADHIIPLAKGGTGERSNYQLLCRPCAKAKDARDRGVKLKPTIAADGWPVEETGK